MIKVLIVDDSVVFRKILQDALSKTSGIRVVGTANNGKKGIEKIKELKPDLVILDVEMPEMDGLQTLDEIRRQRLKVGVIMFSSLTSKGAQTTLEALSKGAFDFVPKPTGTGAFSESVKRIKEELIPKIKAFAVSRHQRRRPIRRPVAPVRPLINRRTKETSLKQDLDKSTSNKKTVESITKTRQVIRSFLRPEVVAIGVSTGGPNALNEVIPKFPKNFPVPILLVQHMPPVFTAQLAKRLNDKSQLNVIEAKAGDVIKAGTVYIAPGDYHMEVGTNGVSKIIKLNQKPPVNSCRPAVDVTFKSVANVYGGRVVAVIMTGMGQDGFEGCKVLKQKGAVIIAQDRETSVVWGMPKFVTEAGLADKVCPLDRIAITVQEFCNFSAMHRVAGNK